jgi:hypothetical protein
LRKTSAYARRRARQDPLRARYDHLTSIYRVIGRIQPFTPDEAAELSLPVHAAFDGLLNGTATDAEYHTLVAITEVCLLMAEQIDQGLPAVVREAKLGLSRCRARKLSLGRYGLDGPARQDIAAVVDMHDQLLELCTPLQLSNAMKSVIARIDAGETFEVSTAG